MVQVIEQSDRFGKIGKAFGEGLAEQIPKEVERYRLSSGLKKFSEQSANLSPVQQLAQLSSIPGITPQMVQSFGELARYQNQGNAYKNAAGQQTGPGSKQPTTPGTAEEATKRYINDRIAEERKHVKGFAGGETDRSPYPKRSEEIPQATEGNPLNPQNLSRLPWTPQERNAVISDYLNQGFLVDQAKQLAADDEARYLKEPEIYQTRQEEVKNAKTEATDALRAQLEKKLQKTGSEIYADIEGPMLANAERGMIRDLILNPKLDPDNVANDWSNRLLETARTKRKLQNLGETTGIESILKGSDTSKKLAQYQKIFEKSDNLEEFKDLLKGKSIGMSEYGASAIAFPPSNDKLKNFIEKWKPSYDPTNNEEKARQAALILGPAMGENDSALALGRLLLDKDPTFNIRAFLDQISEDQDVIRLNKRQQRELTEGSPNILPNWADLLYRPIFRR